MIIGLADTSALALVFAAFASLAVLTALASTDITPDLTGTLDLAASTSALAAAFSFSFAAFSIALAASFSARSFSFWIRASSF